MPWVKNKAAESFQLLQMGVAYHTGADLEKGTHALKGSIEEHWTDKDFVGLRWT